MKQIILICLLMNSSVAFGTKKDPDKACSPRASSATARLVNRMVNLAHTTSDDSHRISEKTRSLLIDEAKENQDLHRRLVKLETFAKISMNKQEAPDVAGAELLYQAEMIRVLGENLFLPKRRSEFSWPSQIILDISEIQSAFAKKYPLSRETIFLILQTASQKPEIANELHELVKDAPNIRLLTYFLRVLWLAERFRDQKK